MTNTTTCKRCGQSDLAWVQSKKTGRYYLALTQKFHGAPLGGDGGYSKGGITVLAHRPHKCDDPRSGRPVCETCGHRHAVGNSICEVHQRVNAAANPQWDAYSPARRPSLTRHSLNAGDFHAEIEHDAETGEVLVTVWYHNQTWTDADGVTYRDASFPNVDEAKAKVLEIISI